MYLGVNLIQEYNVFKNGSIPAYFYVYFRLFRMRRIKFKWKKNINFENTLSKPVSYPMKKTSAINCATLKMKRLIG